MYTLATMFLNWPGTLGIRMLQHSAKAVWALARLAITGKASGDDDAAELSSLPLKAATAEADSASLQSGEFVAAADVAEAN